MKDGYIPFTVPGPDGTNRTKRQERLHRLVWELAHGPLPVEVMVLHYCDVKACFELEHLHVGDHILNMAEAAERGRMRSWNRLPEVIRVEVRKLVEVGLSDAEVAAQLNLDHSTVSRWRSAMGREATKRKIPRATIEKIERLLGEGLSQQRVADQLGLHLSTVHRQARRIRQGGS